MFCSPADMANIWVNCAFYDTSMTSGTQLGHALMKIFGYRAIAVLTHNSDGGHFPNLYVPLK